MSGFIDYVNNSLSDIENCKSLYLFKQRIIGEMTERANELIGKGIKDNKMITDIIIGEYPDLKAQYLKEVATSKNKKKKVKLTKTAFLGVVGYILALVFVFLAISFATSAWGKTWMILVGGLLVPFGFLMIISAFKNKKGGFTQRISLAAGIMLIVIVIFLFMLIVMGITKSWILFLLGILAALIIDAAYAIVCKGKVTYSVFVMYLPVIAALLYVVGGLAKVIPWHPGWMIIVAAVIVDIVIMMFKVATSKNNEEDEVWKKG